MAVFTNQATLTYNGNVINSNITTGELLEVLSATKTAVVDTYTQGSEVTYVIQIVNSGATTFSGVNITDDLGAYTYGTQNLVPLDYVEGSVRYYVNGTLQAAPNVTAGPPLEIRGVLVPAGGVATVIYVAKINGFAPLGLDGEIVNTAQINGSGVTEIFITETISPQRDANLTISKSLCPSVVTENGQLTYTFVIQNTGNVPIVATDGVTVTDTFNPILRDLAVTYNGNPWTEGVNYSYSEVTGVFTTTVGPVTVPAATYVQDPTTGQWIVEPGVGVLVVTGTV